MTIVGSRRMKTMTTAMMMVMMMMVMMIVGGIAYGSSVDYSSVWTDDGEYSQDFAQRLGVMPGSPPPVRSWPSIATCVGVACEYSCGHVRHFVRPRDAAHSSPVVWLVCETSGDAMLAPVIAWDAIARRGGSRLTAAKTARAVLLDGHAMLLPDGSAIGVTETLGASDFIMVLLAMPTKVVWMTCGTDMLSCTTQGSVSVGFGEVVHGVVIADDGQVFVASEAGLFVSLSPSSAFKPFGFGVPEAVPVVALDYVSGHGSVAQQLAFATNANAQDPLGRVFVASNLTTIEFFWQQSVVDSNITSLAFSRSSDGTDDGTHLWVGSATGLSVMHMDTGVWQRFGGLRGGLPHYNITSLAAPSSNDVWVGTRNGLVHFSNVTALPATTQPRWRYYAGLRWLNGDTVSTVFAAPWLPDGNVFVSSGASGGVTMLYFRTMSLEDKADLYQAMVEPRHDRFGLVSDVGLHSLGDLSTYYKRPSDNDGTWTAIYLMGQVYRHLVKQDEASLQAAIKAWTALELLNNVTGIKGLPARSVVTRGTPTGSGEWFNSTAPRYTNFTWKGDTSSDEVISHFNAHFLFYGLTAPDENYRSRSKAVLVNIMDYVMLNNYTLIDGNGKRTRWGFWDPKDLDEPLNYSERGENALELLTMLLVTYSLTGEVQYIEAAQNMGVAHGYFEKTANSRVNVPIDFDFSDDELLYEALWPYFRALQSLRRSNATVSPLFSAALSKCWSRAWPLVRREHSSLYTFMQAVFAPSQVSDADMHNAISNLQQYPTELIDWSYDNTGRSDVILDNTPFREGPAGTRVLPASERSNLRWNADVFQLRGGSGFTEYDPGAWLSAYWLGRYFHSLPVP